MRAALLALGFCAASGAVTLAADLPPTITEEKRAEIMKRWRESYDKSLEKLQRELADAKLKKLKGPTAELSERINAMKKEPLRFGENVINGLGESPKVGRVGMLLPKTLTVGEIRPEGVVVEGLYTSTVWRGNNGFGGGGSEEKVARFLVASPLPRAKLKEKVPLPGLWYVAGEAKVANGRTVPIIYPVEVKPGEVPESPKKK